MTRRYYEHLPKGITHNDLHADNVMVDDTDNSKDPQPTIIDFGRALPFGRRLFPRPLAFYERFPYLDPYLSFEQGLTSPASDVYSFAYLVTNMKEYKDCPHLKKLLDKAKNSDPSKRSALDEFVWILKLVQKIYLLWGKEWPTT